MVPPRSVPLDTVSPRKKQKQKQRQRQKQKQKGKKWLLDNKGSTARDHLANERTFLAWTRTSLVIVSAGIAFVQMSDILLRAHHVVHEDSSTDMTPPETILIKLAKPLGGLCGAFAVVVAIFGYYRYVTVQVALTNDKFPASRILTGIVIFLALVVLILILVIDVTTV